MRAAKSQVKIAIVGKYFKSGEYVLSDVYISIIEALKHAGVEQNVQVSLDWLDSTDYENDPKKLLALKRYNGILVPGGFGSRGVEGKILAIAFARKNKIPFLGICYGMQLAVVEFARNTLRLINAHTAEIDPGAKHKIIDIMPEQKEKLRVKDYGGSMRLGAYPAHLLPGSLAHKAYGKNKISERHRHRYEVNPEYLERLRDGGLIVSGLSPDKKLAEIIELPKNAHPFFVASQFHPEFQSSLLNPHPLFSAFVKACKK